MIAGGRRTGDEDTRQKKRDNVNQYAVKKKLEQRKVERTQINQRQISAHGVLLDYIQKRKAMPVGFKDQFSEVYIKPSEVERAFLDALGLITQSGYFLEQNDFFELLQILGVTEYTTQVHGRAQIFEFFSYAANLLEFDVQATENFITSPWNLEAEMMSVMEMEESLGQRSPSQLDAGDSIYSVGGLGTRLSKTHNNE